MGRLARSESTWNDNVIHSNSNWKGLFGINKPVWKNKCPHNPDSRRGNTFAAAWILNLYLAENNNNMLSALHHYKSYKPQGLIYAKHVLYSH